MFLSAASNLNFSINSRLSLYFLGVLGDLTCIVRGFLAHNRGCDSDNCDAADTREPIAALSGISRTSRVAVVSIQRISPCISPVISAVIRQIMQFLQLV